MRRLFPSLACFVSCFRQRRTFGYLERHSSTIADQTSTGSLEVSSVKRKGVVGTNVPHDANLNYTELTQLRASVTERLKEIRDTGIP